MTADDLRIDTTITLNNGVEIPVFGLGTFRMKNPAETRRAVLSALEAGYRHIDTAKIYGNEREIGKAIRESGILREDIFVTTKLWNADHGCQKTLKAFEKSLKRLGLEYIDLYLIHWPVEGIRKDTWKAMGGLLVGGKCRSIGVSNYMIRHLEELLDRSSVIPAVNQVEFHPYLYQQDLLQFCNENNIQLETYCPLTRGRRLDDSKLKSLADHYSKTKAQILIRWALQHDLVVIPKSSNPKRILENADVFDFSIAEEDMKTLDSFHENLRVSWDPTNVQ